MSITIKEIALKDMEYDTVIIKTSVTRKTIYTEAGISALVIDLGQMETPSRQAWFDREGAARFWPIVKHFAETGELAEVPNVIDNSIPARDGVSFNTLVGRVEALAYAIESIGRDMTALDERLKAVEKRTEITQAENSTGCKIVVSFVEHDPYTYWCNTKEEALRETGDVVRRIMSGTNLVITGIEYVND